mmetsp:Transcript_27555/g.55276  ORF Transcript_27555/g.55276 Transcript_27555/m.55276 type:complete len:622 (-) Transcript_27555:127-1992(-)
MSSPQGQTIGKASKPWTIGRLLGSGACGSVHELLDPPNSKTSSMQYAIKCVNLPPSSAKASTNKKRKKTAVERNADLLLHEYTILQNSGVNRGTKFPEIPLMGIGGPPGYGETADKKFRYLVMERMAAPLAEIVPILLNNNSTKASSIKIPLGDVATSLFNCIHAMHTQNYLFQDVKPDNFMLATPNNNTSRGKKSSNNNVANRIRLIDFGLVERYSEMASSSHREDAFPGAQLVGTPTYASLNVMGGHTPSRRDDLEALGYVICEVILLLLVQSGGGRKRKGKGGETEEDVLPWSHAKSDDELYQIKQQEMDKSKRSKSTLFSELKAAGGVDVPMGKYFNEVMNLEYAEKPDYDSLRGHLNKIVVAVTMSSGGKKVAAATRGGSKKAAAASPKKAAAAPAAPAAAAGKSPRRNPSRRTKEKEQSSQSSVSSDENVENCKKQKVSSRTIATQTDDGMICLLDDSSEEEENEVQDMDWEVLDNNDNDDNVAPAAAAASRSKSAFLKLEVISGSQKGQEVSFGGNYPDTVVVGREPSSSTAKALKDSAKLALTQDDRVSSIHAKFVIASKKNLHSVRVTDMSSFSSDEATLVNGTRLASGKSRQAFVGDKITVGGSILQVKRA